MPPRLQVGCWLGLPSPEIAEIVAGTGFDFALIDLEHGTIGIETAQRMLMALRRPRRPLPMVRVPEAGEGWIKRALDAGAAAVMVPRVEDAATAARLAGFATYGPEGRRGVGVGVARAAGWGRDAAGYRGRWRERRRADPADRVARRPRRRRRDRRDPRRHPALLRPVRLLRLPRHRPRRPARRRRRRARSRASPAPPGARPAASPSPAPASPSSPPWASPMSLDASDIALLVAGARRPSRRRPPGARACARVSSPSTRAA